MRGDLTVERLREVLDYDPITGVFTRLVRNPSGKAAGSDNGSGYNRIYVDGHLYRANRLAWLYVHGRWPAGVVDHRNGDTTDDSIVNLRDTTQSANSQNAQNRKPQTGGAVGVEERVGKTRTTWRAHIFYDGRRRHLGTFATQGEAASVADAARRKFHEGLVVYP